MYWKNFKGKGVPNGPVKAVRSPLMVWMEPTDVKIECTSCRLQGMDKVSVSLVPIYKVEVVVVEGFEKIHVGAGC